MAKDIIHNSVKNALIKDGWKIIADPFQLDYEEFTLFADLAANKSFVAEKDRQQIVVEVKSFIGRSFVKDLQYALGQYEMYRDCLEMASSGYTLYLAINEHVYFNFFTQKASQMIVNKHNMKIMIERMQK
jgi:hypothetical protein